MGRITVDLLRKRAEHNDKNLATLQEITLHQQNIERIELINQLCRNIKILYLQNNVICKIEKLNRLKELEHLNLAVNNIAKIQNLQRCESLRRLDLTINFVDKAGLLTVASLKENEFLEELFLVGNPCTKWPGYRTYVVGLLPRLKRLDGEDVLPSERIVAHQQWAALHEQLRTELNSEGIDPDKAAEVEDDSLLDAEEIPETGYIDEEGELRRPWCRETRILEHREQEREIQAAEEKRQGEQKRLFSSQDGLWGAPEEPKPREGFPPLVEGEPVYQKNEGKWDFSLGESCDGLCVVLDVDVGRYLDTSLIQADVQPTVVRLLIKGRLLQLLLPQEVRPDFSVAQRSKTTGHLVLTMPKENPEHVPDVTRTRGPPPKTVIPLGMWYGGGSAAAGGMGEKGVGEGPAASGPGQGVFLAGMRPQPRTLRPSNCATSGGAKGGAKAGPMVWVVDTEGNYVERQLQKAHVVVEGVGREDEWGGESDEPPPL